MNAAPFPRFLAEVSSNHNRDLERCLRFIDTAAAIGCDGVKFQLFQIDQLFAPEILAHSPRHAARRAWELPVDFLEPIAGRCRARDLAFVCTPFYLDAVALLAPLVDAFKVASYELLWDDLLVACAATGRPLILSAGMATLAEVEHAVEVIHRATPAPERLDLTLLHCVSAYPTPREQCQLAAIGAMRDALAPRFPGVRFGWSDHSVDPDVVRQAIARWDASLIEFHLDLEGAGMEAAVGHCWLPEGIRRVIDAVRRGEHSAMTPDPVIDGTRAKVPAPAEAVDRLWRADPSDGLRPLLSTRAQWLTEIAAS
jgi:sialic acid synthase SpsE